MVFKDKEEFSQLVGDNMDYINQHRWPPLSYEQAMEEYRKKYLEEESDESGEENNESEGEGGSEGGAGSSEGGEGKSSGVEKRKLRTGRKGSVAGRQRTHNKAAAAVAGGRGKSSNKCRVM